MNLFFHKTPAEISSIKPTGEFPSLPVLLDRELGGEDLYLGMITRILINMKVPKRSINENNISHVF